MAEFNAQKVSKVKAVNPDASFTVEGTDGGTFAIASSKKELKQLTKSDADVVYDERKGKLFLNDNGTARGWGAKKVGFDPPDHALVHICNLEGDFHCPWIRATSALIAIMIQTVTCIKRNQDMAFAIHNCLSFLQNGKLINQCDLLEYQYPFSFWRMLRFSNRTNLFVSTLLIPIFPKILSFHSYSSIGACPLL